MRQTSWKSFWLWALAGGLLTFAMLAITSIGLYMLPIAVITIVIVARRAALWPQIVGLAEGCAVPIFWASFINWGIPRCADGPLSLIGTGTFSYTGATMRGCTTVDARRWLIIALMLALGGIAVYGLALMAKTNGADGEAA